MRSAVVFNSSSHLDFQEIRANVVRIPEVAARLREAQEVWDEVAGMELDLNNFIASDDSTFLGHIKLKCLATAIVQVGLLDRYLKTQPVPEVFIGAINGDAPLKVAIGEQTLEEMIRQSSSMNQAGRRKTETGGSTLPILAGIELAQFGAYSVDSASGEFQQLNLQSRELEALIGETVKSQDLNRVIVIGPGSSIFGRQLSEFTTNEVSLVESIEIDPLLSWFWACISDEHVAVAN